MRTRIRILARFAIGFGGGVLATFAAINLVMLVLGMPVPWPS